MLNSEDTLVVVIDCQDKLLSAIYEKEKLVCNSVKLLEGLRILNIPIIVTQQYTKGLGMTVKEIQNVIENKEYIDKITFDCCGNSEFVELLEKYNKQNIIICGIEAHICVRQTALSLLKCNKKVHLIEDCISSRRENDKRIALYQLSLDKAILTTYEAVLFELLGKANGDKFKQISKLIK